MKLFNKTIDRQLFKQYALGSDLSKQEAVVKIFNPQGAGTWFILNSDPEDPDYLWAIVDLGYGAEVGSVSRTDLETYRGRFGLGFERDLSFDPVNAEELYEGLRAGKFYADGGSFKELNSEVILTENKTNGANWRGVVKPFMLKSIQENQYSGGFKRYEIDVYDEVEREPTKEEIKKANEFFDKVGGRYADGGKIENKYSSYTDFVNKNIGEDKFVLSVGSGGVSQPREGATKESIDKQFKSLVFHNFKDYEFSANYMPESYAKEYNGFIEKFYNSLIENPKEFIEFWNKFIIQSGQYDSIYSIRPSIYDENGKYIESRDWVDNKWVKNHIPHYPDLIFSKYKKEMSSQLIKEYQDYLEEYAGDKIGYNFANGGKIAQGSKYGDWAITQYVPLEYGDLGELSGGLIKLVNQDTMEDLIIRNDNAVRGNTWFISYKGAIIENKDPKVVIEKLLKKANSEMSEGGGLQNKIQVKNFADLKQGDVVRRKDKLGTTIFVIVKSPVQSRSYKNEYDVLATCIVSNDDFHKPFEEYHITSVIKNGKLGNVDYIGKWNYDDEIDYSMYLPKSRKKFADGGEVSFIDYKDSLIMFEPHYDKYYANNVEFDSLQEAKDFLDSGEIDPRIRDAYARGLFAKGGSVSGDEVSLAKGYGYYDLSKYAYGNDFKRFVEPVNGKFIKGTVKVGGQIRVLLDDGREIITDKQAIYLPTYDEKDELYQQNKHLFSFGYADGGDIENFSDNQRMIMNQNVEVEHHHEELEDILEEEIEVPAWVVAKMETATQNLSDITHYLDGEKDLKEDQEEEYGEFDYSNLDEEEEDEDEIKNKEVVEPINVSAGTKAEMTKNFTDNAWGNLRGFLKGMEGIDLRDDYTFDYKDEQFEVEPIINSDENGVSNAVFTLFDGDGEEQGEVTYSRDGGKQKFTANSELFGWNNAKFEDGGFMNDVYAKGGQTPKLSELREEKDGTTVNFFQNYGNVKFRTQVSKFGGKYQVYQGGDNLPFQNFPNVTFDKRVDAINFAKNSIKNQIDEYKLHYNTPKEIKDYVGKHFAYAHNVYYIGALKKYNDLGQYKPSFLVLEIQNDNTMNVYDPNQRVIKGSVLHIIDLENLKKNHKIYRISSKKLPSKYKEKIDSKKAYFERFSDKKYEDGGYFDGAIPNVSTYMSNYAKGGEIAKAEVFGLKRNFMGTTDIEMKITGMRKPQEFSVYPIGKDDTDKIITIQSETRIGKIDLSSGRGLMSQSHSNGAYFVHLQMDELTPFTVSESDLENIKSHIFKTAGDNVGSRGIVSDNSGASRIFAEGGGIGFIPMALEEDLRITAKWGGTDIKGVIGFLNAMIDSDMTDEDLKPKPTKSGNARQNAIDKKTREIWSKIEPNYKGGLKGNMYYSTIHRLVDRANTSDEILKRFKPFRKLQKDSFADGGSFDNFDGIAYAKTNAKRGMDWDKELREYAGSEYSKLTEREKEAIISDLMRDWDRSNSFADGGNFDKPFNVLYKTKSGTTMVAKRIMAKDKEEAERKLEKQMRASSSFDKVVMSHPSFEDGGFMPNVYADGGKVDTKLSLAKVKSIAQETADFLGSDFTVTEGTIDEASFDLDYKNEKFDGGSYLIMTNGDVVNFAIPSKPIVYNYKTKKEYADGGFIDKYQVDRFKQVMNGKAIAKYIVRLQDSFGNKETYVFGIKLSDQFRGCELVPYEVLYGGWSSSGTPFSLSNLQVEKLVPNKFFNIELDEEQTEMLVNKLVKNNEAGVKKFLNNAFFYLTYNKSFEDVLRGHFALSVANLISVDFEIVQKFADGGFTSDVYTKGGMTLNEGSEHDGYNLKDINGKKIEVGDTVKTTQPSGGLLSPADSEVGVVEKTKDAFGQDALQIKYRRQGTNYDRFILLNGKINEIVSKSSSSSKEKKYILKADIKTVTVKRNNKEVTYKGADVLNGANVLSDGGDISSKANYIPKRDVVEVELKDGSTVKPVNGYWVKKGAEPIGTDPIPTASGKSETKINTTEIRKDPRGNWRAETFIEDFDGYDWKITTIKTYSGQLLTSAQGGKAMDSGSKGISMFSYTMYQDPHHTLEVSKPKRLTEKVVSEQHDKGLAKFKKFMETGMFKGGGKISNFDKLSAKVAKQYEGKAVKNPYQEEYGKYYSKEEAQEVGDKVAGKVKAMQGDSKAFGGFFSSAKNLMKPSVKYPNLTTKQVQLKSGRYVQVFNQTGDKLDVIFLGDIDRNVKPHTINIDEVDLTTMRMGGEVEERKPTAGSELMKKANILAKEIRKDGESWLDARKRAFAQLKK